MTFSRDYSDIEQKITDETVISIRRGSIVTGVTLSDGNQLVSKCFLPEAYRNLNPEIYKAYCQLFEGKEEPLSGGSYLPHLSARYSYNKERSVLAAINGLGEDNFAPRLIPSPPNPDCRIFMERIADKTCREEITRKPQSKTELLDYMIEVTAEVHYRSNLHREQLLATHWGNTRAFRFRNTQEEVERWIYYFQNLIYYQSEEFHEEYKNRINKLKNKTRTPSREENQSLINAFCKKILRSKKVSLPYEPSLSGFVNWFIQEERKMIYGWNHDPSEKDLDEITKRGLLSVVHGDLHPGNIFHAKGNKIEICDFTHARLAHRYLDPVNIMYEPPFSPLNPEEEMSMLETLDKYRQMVQEKGGISLSPEDTIKHAIVKRLKDGIRTFSIYCRYTEKDIEEFIPFGFPEKKRLKDSNSREKFLESIYGIKIASLFDYFLKGEGWDIVLRPQITSSELTRRLNNFLVQTKEFLDYVGIKDPTKYERQKRFQSLIQNPPP